MAGMGKKEVMLFGQRNRWSLHHLYEQETELWDISLCIAEFQQQLAKYKQE
jgi:hypothetical protein